MLEIDYFWSINMQKGFKIYKWGLLFLFIQVFPVQKAFSQAIGGVGPKQDYQTWLWFQVDKDFTKHINLGVQYQERIDATNYSFKWSYFYLNGEYKLNKHFNVQAVYQYCTSYQFDLHSFYVGATGKMGIGRWKFALRTAWQNEIVHFSPKYADEQGNETKYEWRNRATVRYKLFSNITAFAFSEPYLRYGYRDPYIDKIRSGFGIDYDFNKYNTFTLYYLMQPEYDIKSQTIQNVLGFVYSVSLPRKKMKWHKFFNPKKTKVIEEDTPEKDENALDKS